MSVVGYIGIKASEHQVKSLEHQGKVIKHQKKRLQFIADEAAGYREHSLKLYELQQKELEIFREHLRKLQLVERSQEFLSRDDETGSMWTRNVKQRHLISQHSCPRTTVPMKSGLPGEMSRRQKARP